MGCHLNAFRSNLVATVNSLVFILSYVGLAIRKYHYLQVTYLVTYVMIFFAVQGEIRDLPFAGKFETEEIILHNKITGAILVVAQMYQTYVGGRMLRQRWSQERWSAWLREKSMKKSGERYRVLQHKILNGGESGARGANGARSKATKRCDYYAFSACCPLGSSLSLCSSLTPFLFVVIEVEGSVAEFLSKIVDNLQTDREHFVCVNLNNILMKAIKIKRNIHNHDMIRQIGDKTYMVKRTYESAEDILDMLAEGEGKNVTVDVRESVDDNDGKENKVVKYLLDCDALR